MIIIARRCERTRLWVSIAGSRVLADQKKKQKHHFRNTQGMYSVP